MKQNETRKYENPVIPGFYPDPSVCRVGSDYFLATSSFNYFPGIPLFHSRDLVNWRRIGHALTRSSQFNVTGRPTWHGLYAPTLRHHDGRFYMIVGNMPDRHGFYVYTDDIFSGEWSEPVTVDAHGFDQDLFFDDDGKVYYQHHNLGRPHIDQWEIDIETGRLLSERRTIWTGFADELCEAPHLYKINGKYYLLAAEGGTYGAHMITVGRSDSPSGPFEQCPHNPLLCHAFHVFSPIKHTGHGDLIEDHNGNWWVFFLATRPNSGAGFGGGTHCLGRETFLAPVDWTDDGWPLINGGNPVELEMESDKLPVSQPWPAEPARDDFDLPVLAPCWNFIGNPQPGEFSLSERPGFLTLHGSGIGLDALDHPVFAGRRQCHKHCAAGTEMNLSDLPEGGEAGLSCMMDNRHHFDLVVRLKDGVRMILLRQRIGELLAETFAAPLESDTVRLRVEADPHHYRFSYAPEGGAYAEAGTAQPHYISTEVAGGFTGVYFGVFAVRCTALFDWFDYEKGEENG